MRLGQSDIVRRCNTLQPPLALCPRPPSVSFFSDYKSAGAANSRYMADTGERGRNSLCDDRFVMPRPTADLLAYLTAAGSAAVSRPSPSLVYYTCPKRGDRRVVKNRSIRPFLSGLKGP